MPCPRPCRKPSEGSSTVLGIRMIASSCRWGSAMVMDCSHPRGKDTETTRGFSCCSTARIYWSNDRHFLFFQRNLEGGLTNPSTTHQIARGKILEKPSHRTGGGSPNSGHDEGRTRNDRPPASPREHSTSSSRWKIPLVQLRFHAGILISRFVFTIIRSFPRSFDPVHSFSEQRTRNRARCNYDLTPSTTSIALDHEDACSSSRCHACSS